MAKKHIENHKQRFKDKGKATLIFKQFSTTRFKQDPEDKVDSVFRTRIKDK